MPDEQEDELLEILRDLRALSLEDVTESEARALYYERHAEAFKQVCERMRRLIEDIKASRV
jgi:hypothetical protein